MKQSSLERAFQGLDFAYGQLAASTNHKPKRDAFEKLATSPDGLALSSAAFEAWANGKRWW